MMEPLVENDSQRSTFKMAKLQSPRIQCCLCTCSVFSALFGMFMLSAGVCLVLNYNFLNVDTSGLPPNLHNEEGKKVVGIILICVGLASMVLGGLVSTLYFTACNLCAPCPASVRPDDPHHKGQGRPPSQESQGHHHGHSHSHVNGAAAGGRASPASRRGTGSLPNLRRPTDARGVGPAYSRSISMQGRNHTPPTSSRSHHGGKAARHGKSKSKSRHHAHQGRFRNPLETHPEEAGADAQSLSESRRSAGSSKRVLFPQRTGVVNEGATLDDGSGERASSSSSSSASSSMTPSVIITVDSSHLTETSDDQPASRSFHPASVDAAVYSMTASHVVVDSRVSSGARDFSMNVSEVIVGREVSSGARDYSMNGSDVIVSSQVSSGARDFSMNGSDVIVGRDVSNDARHYGEGGRASRSSLESVESSVETGDSARLNDQILKLVS